jgi:hypothetical protein
LPYAKTGAAWRSGQTDFCMVAETGHRHDFANPKAGLQKQASFVQDDERGTSEIACATAAAARR